MMALCTPEQSSCFHTHFDLLSYKSTWSSFRDIVARCSVRDFAKAFAYFCFHCRIMISMLDVSFVLLIEKLQRGASRRPCTNASVQHGGHGSSHLETVARRIFGILRAKKKVKFDLFVGDRLRWFTLDSPKRSKDGMMQWPEFCELLQCLTFWHNTFCQYDQDRSGYIEALELGRVIRERYGEWIWSGSVERQ